ncbi:hypothetical protein C8Q80DRAFT_1266245 [Daedaleopsis nitida]|nr:hypothetical protein C8Q80DRAFT_1266245 [Daedaleopsis nitida]
MNAGGPIVTGAVAGAGFAFLHRPPRPFSQLSPPTVPFLHALRATLKPILSSPDLRSSATPLPLPLPEGRGKLQWTLDTRRQTPGAILETPMAHAAPFDRASCTEPPIPLLLERATLRFVYDRACRSDII